MAGMRVPASWTVPAAQEGHDRQRGYRTGRTARSAPTAEHAPPLGDDTQLEARVDAQLVHQLGDPAPHRADPHAEVAGDRLVLEAAREQREQPGGGVALEVLVGHGQATGPGLVEDRG